MGSELFPQSLEGHLTELCLQPFVGISASRDDGLRRVDQDVVVNEADPIFVAWQGKIGLMTRAMASLPTPGNPFRKMMQCGRYGIVAVAEEVCVSVAMLPGKRECCTAL